MISVLLVDDSPLVLEILKRMLRAPDSDIQVVGTASNGKEALRKVIELNPQVICTDYHMPVMDGLEFTREVMANYPRPILVVSIAVQKGKDDINIFEFLESGAIDVFPKPEGGLKCEFDSLAQQLIRKIRVLSGVTMFARVARDPKTGLRIRRDTDSSGETSATLQYERTGRTHSTSDGKLSISARVLAIGASTGGPQALNNILAALPPNLRMPVICVQHISEGFLQGLIDWLSIRCRLPVQIAVDGQTPSSGIVYFPPENCQLIVDGHGKFNTKTVIPDERHKPSVTVTFDSLAKYYRKSVIAVLLTGIGKDGALGMQSIHAAGGFTIAEDESSCVVFGMPKEAINLGAATQIWSLPTIVSALASLQ